MKLADLIFLGCLICVDSRGCGYLCIKNNDLEMRSTKYVRDNRYLVARSNRYLIVFN
jgi:hypothetical protein